MRGRGAAQAQRADARSSPPANLVARSALRGYPGVGRKERGGSVASVNRRSDAPQPDIGEAHCHSNFCLSLIRLSRMSGNSNVICVKARGFGMPTGSVKAIPIE